MPSSFSRIYEDEAACAAYNGFVDVGAFRQFLATEMFVRAFEEFISVSKNLKSAESLEILRDDKTFEQPLSIKDARQRWAEDGSNAGANRLNRQYRLANVIASLTQYIRNASTNPPTDAPRMNDPQQYFSNTLPHLNAPTAFEMSTTVLPKLGPFDNFCESDLEAYNRVYCMFRYFRYVATSKGPIWKTRFLCEDWNSPRTVMADSVPGWMRPAQTGASLATLEDVSLLSKRDGKQWDIIWKKSQKFNGKDILDKHLEDVVADLPSTKQILDADPRLYDAPSWRDSIRRQFHCQELGLNIRSIQLIHTPSGREEVTEA